MIDEMDKGANEQVDNAILLSYEALYEINKFADVKHTFFDGGHL